MQQNRSTVFVLLSLLKSRGIEGIVVHDQADVQQKLTHRTRITPHDFDIGLETCKKVSLQSLT